MAGFLSELLNDYRVQLERYRNRPFLEAAMAGSALVAIADGEVSLAERFRVDQVYEAIDALQVYDPHEAVDLFNDYAESIRGSPKAGRERAVQTLKAVADDREKAELLVRICLAVAEAGGGRSLVHEIEVVTLCSLLGVDPRRAGLYPERPPEDLLGD